MSAGNKKRRSGISHCGAEVVGQPNLAFEADHLVGANFRASGEINFRLVCAAIGEFIGADTRARQ
jgi:hypothetical protein